VFHNVIPQIDNYFLDFLTSDCIYILFNPFESIVQLNEGINQTLEIKEKRKLFNPMGPAEVRAGSPKAKRESGFEGYGFF
jgi:hypothetical protein